MPSVPDPGNVKPWYLRNITEALALDEASGNVYVRTGFTGNIIISGDVNIPGNIQVYSTPEDPVHTHITEVGTTGILDVPYIPINGNVVVSSGNITFTNTTIEVTQGTDPWNISGNVDVLSLPAITGNVNANVSGNVGVLTLPSITGNVVVTSGNINSNVTGNVVVTSGNVNASVTGNIVVTSGNVDANVHGNVGIIGNVNVTQGTDPWMIEGNVNITNTNPIEITGTIDTGGASKESAFGEMYGITITPVVQMDSIYGITPDVIDTFLFGTGSTADANQGIYSVSAGTTSTGYAALTSIRFLRYRPGQGALARFTAGFSPNVAQTNQRAGLFNRESAIQVGIHDDGTGPKFGVIRASGGKTHITVLTINTAPTGAQTATVTLNGVPYTITGIVASTTIETAVQIAKVGVFTGWFVDQVDDTLVFNSLYTGPALGTFSFSSTGIGTLTTGTFSTKQVGVVQTDQWTYQEDFNIDTLDGNGPSGMDLAPEHLNVYQINFRWLGVGEIRYAIEDSITGKMIFFHKEHYTNRYNLPHISQPSFRLGYISQNVGSTTPATVYGASMMGAIEGIILQNELNRSTSTNKTGLNTGSVHHLLTLRNPYVTNGKSGALNGLYKFNAKEIILKDVTVATQGNDPAVLYVFFNATSFSGTQVYYSQPRDNGMVSTATGTFDPSIDTAICRFATAINGQVSYPVRDFRVTVPPGTSVSFAIASTSNLSRVTFAVVFSED